MPYIDRRPWKTDEEREAFMDNIERGIEDSCRTWGVPRDLYVNHLAYIDGWATPDEAAQHERVLQSLGIAIPDTVEDNGRDLRRMTDDLNESTRLLHEDTARLREWWARPDIFDDLARAILSRKSEGRGP